MRKRERDKVRMRESEKTREKGVKREKGRSIRIRYLYLFIDER